MSNVQQSTSSNVKKGNAAKPAEVTKTLETGTAPSNKPAEDVGASESTSDKKEFTAEDLAQIAKCQFAIKAARAVREQAEAALEAAQKGYSDALKALHATAGGAGPYGPEKLTVVRRVTKDAAGKEIGETFFLKGPREFKQVSALESISL